MCGNGTCPCLFIVSIQRCHSHASVNFTIAKYIHTHLLLLQVIHAWAKSDHFQCGEHAQCILDRLDEATAKNPSLQTNRVALNAAIQAWSRQGSINQAEAIFTRMQQDPAIDMELSDYNAMLASYARQGDTAKTESLFQSLQSLSDTNGNVRPDLNSYNYRLEAWARSEAPDSVERTESILNEMKEKFDDGTSTIRPNDKSYSYVAHANSRLYSSEEAIRKTEALLREAEGRGLGITDTHLHNALLDTWADSPRPDAARVAEKMLLYEMEQYGVVNSVSYNLVIKALAHSNDSDAPQRAENILDRMEYLQSNSPTMNVAPDAFTFTTVVRK